MSAETRIRRKIVATSFCALAALFGVRPAAAQPAGGYTLDWLTQDQRARLDRSVDSFALGAGALDRCGWPQHLEKRVREAVAGCIAPASLDIVAKRYRNVRNGVMSMPNAFCDADIKRRLPKWNQEISAIVTYLRDKCAMVRACPECKPDLAR